MKIKILEQNENTIKFEINEDHTFLNLLRSSLWKYKDLEDARYFFDGYYSDKSKFIVKIKKGSTIDVLKDSSQRIINRIEELEQEFNRIK